MENVSKEVVDKKVSKKDPDLFLVLTAANVVNHWNDLSGVQKKKIAGDLDLSVRSLYRYFSDYQKDDQKLTGKKNDMLFKMVRAAKVASEWSSYTTSEKENVADSFGLSKRTIERYLNEQNKFDWKGKKDSDLFKAFTAQRVTGVWDTISTDTKKILSEDFEVSIRTLYRYISDYQKEIKSAEKAKAEKKAKKELSK